jgi:kinesin family protein 6/9
MAKDGA